MATVQTILNRSMRLIKQIGAGESPTTVETADLLVGLNALLDSWRNDRLLCFAFQEESLTLSASTQSYTIGTSGTLNTTRPVEILEAYIVASNLTYPVTLLNEGEWAAIGDKTQTGDWPDRALFRPAIASSQAILLVYPIPNATRTMKLVTRVPVVAFSAATETVTLPPGWEEALASNLAVNSAPEYGAQVPQAVIDMARKSLGGIKRANAQAQPRRLTTGIGRLFGGSDGNILSDGA